MHVALSVTFINIPNRQHREYCCYMQPKCRNMQLHVSLSSHNETVPYAQQYKFEAGTSIIVNPS